MIESAILLVIVTIALTLSIWAACWVYRKLTKRLRPTVAVSDDVETQFETTEAGPYTSPSVYTSPPVPGDSLPQPSLLKSLAIAVLHIVTANLSGQVIFRLTIPFMAHDARLLGMAGLLHPVILLGALCVWLKLFLPTTWGRAMQVVLLWFVGALVCAFAFVGIASQFG